LTARTGVSQPLKERKGAECIRLSLFDRSSCRICFSGRKIAKQENSLVTTLERLDQLLISAVLSQVAFATQGDSVHLSERELTYPPTLPCSELREPRKPIPGVNVSIIVATSERTLPAQQDKYCS
jgi:hypothetical protein